MISYKTIHPDLLEATHEIPYGEAHGLFVRLAAHHRYKFLFESKDISPVYGRVSLAGVDPVLKVTGKGDGFEITSLNERGEFYLQQLARSDFIAMHGQEKKSRIVGTIPKSIEPIEERQRSKRQNSAQV